MIHRELIVNAFRPGSEIENPAAFAGRADDILKLVDTLYIDGSCPLIYGDRGIGKTSLALQLERIALGDVELLTELNCPARALPENRRFVTFFLACSDMTATKNDIFQRLINIAEGYDNLDALPKRELIGQSTKKKISLKFFERETEQKFELTSSQKFSQLDIEERLLSITRTVIDKTNSRILFIIDELDRVKDTSGLASFIKNASSPNIKFVLIGISQSISFLLHDHASLERTLVPVRVKRMDREELSAIISKTMRILAKEGSEFKFDDNATQIIIKAAAGFPWFVHVLGQQSLLLAYDDGRTLIDTNDVNNAIEGLAGNQFAQQFSDLYQKAVRDSIFREKVLRLFAKWSADDIPTSEIYPIAKDLDVRNASIYKKDLTLATYGRILATPPDQARGVVRFRNAMFKRYVDLRKSIYSGVKESVDKAWLERHPPK
jgi:Cdc6-like AAA superfamily ATPase